MDTARKHEVWWLYSHRRIELGILIRPLLSDLYKTKATPITQAHEKNTPCPTVRDIDIDIDIDINITKHLPDQIY
jgi:hypothetical protein